MSDVTDAAYRRYDFARAAAKAGVLIVGEGATGDPQRQAVADAEAALASLEASGAVPPADLEADTLASLEALRLQYEAQRAQAEALAVLPPDIIGPSAGAIGLIMANTAQWIAAIAAVEKELADA
jgi:hypothetical protein